MYSEETKNTIHEFCKEEKQYVIKALDLAQQIKKSSDANELINKAVDAEIDILLDILNKINKYEKTV